MRTDTRHITGYRYTMLKGTNLNEIQLRKRGKSVGLTNKMY